MASLCLIPNKSIAVVAFTAIILIGRFVPQADPVGRSKSPTLGHFKIPHPDDRLMVH